MRELGKLIGVALAAGILVAMLVIQVSLTIQNYQVLKDTHRIQITEIAATKVRANLAYNVGLMCAESRLKCKLP